MYVSHLALNDFRSYREQVVELAPGIVVFQGQNGRGKTNLVEAIAYLSTFSSHRVSSSSNLVRVDRDGEKQPGGAVVRVRVQEENRSVLLELEIARGRANRARLNRANVAPREILGKLRTVVFAPEDLELLRGDPAVRRRFLDEIITKLRPHFLGVRQDFERVLRQRGAVLKQFGRSGYPLSPEDEGVLEVWDRQLAGLSAQIVVNRLAVVQALQPLVANSYRQITDGDRLADVQYRTHLRTEQAADSPLTYGSLKVVEGRIEGNADEQVAELTLRYRERLAEIRSDELRRGINLEGAHRDDLAITLDGLPVRGFASHGEIWSSALMLRLAELELLRLDGDYPVLILDDVFAELDVSRRQGLLSQMKQVEQVLVTVAVEADVPQELHAQRISISRSGDGTSQVEVLVDE
ncbi:DNA replication/repair protein RecF [Schaalia sp. JY-X169]|uniref:DNA replication/repair protein RecF n=1 Tax=Schaalia sp. JY-X169 TaxID=2758572 RepID=UPI0015F5259F|nr:DNA replication/repair protein RecF [Schaalia sp. JY-X169]MBP7880820.1 DNA replication/repair protein RecF [Actinomyces sp.]